MRDVNARIILSGYSEDYQQDIIMRNNTSYLSQN